MSIDRAQGYWEGYAAGLAVATGGVTERTCGACGKVFTAGRLGDRRADAKFCSDRCKTNANNALKIEAVQAYRTAQSTSD